MNIWFYNLEPDNGVAPGFFQARGRILSESVQRTHCLLFFKVIVPVTPKEVTRRYSDFFCQWSASCHKLIGIVALLPR